MPTLVGIVQQIVSLRYTTIIEMFKSGINAPVIYDYALLLLLPLPLLLCRCAIILSCDYVIMPLCHYAIVPLWH